MGKMIEANRRVSPTAAAILVMFGTVDSYWTRKSAGDAFAEVQEKLGVEERDALNLIHRGLFRLFPFDPNRDMPDTMVPRHAL